MFYFRLNKVRVRKNREFIGKAEISLLSFVAVEECDLPRVDDLLRITNEEERKAVIEQAVNKVTGAVQIPEIDKVKKGHEIPFGDTGLNLYRSETVPNDFSWLFMAIESDSKSRRNAAEIKSFFTSDKTQPIVNKVLKVLGKTTPAAAAITTIAPIVFEGICQQVKNNKDDQVGLISTSFIRSLHYPNGLRNAMDVPDATGNMWVDYMIFSD